MPAILALLYSGSYSFPTFVVAPIVLGFLSALLLGFRTPRKTRESLMSGLWALLTVSIFMGVLRSEGLVCMLMASPVVVPLALLGSWIGGSIVNSLHERFRGPISVSFTVLLPFALFASVGIPSHTSYHTHVTVKVFSASPERIWPLLFDMPDLPPGDSLLFRAGMAYPLAIRSKGDHRTCLLSTGPMPERIVERQPFRRLKFEVLATPRAVQETNPFGEVYAPHNDRAFRCIAGQFELEPMPGGGTRVRATSWYEHDYGPEWYWTLWTEAVVSAVHERVLNEIDRRTR
jgi:hypothetical protein